jgi:RimJ/RimL family protein N-acetyltransferase
VEPSVTDPYLVTPRVRLRQYAAADFANLLELNSDPEVMRYLTRRADALEETQFTVERTRHYQQRFDGRLGLFMAELAADSAFIGWFLLRPDKSDPDNTGVLELGYRLKKAFWRQGYATEVSERLVAKAFGELAAEAVFAQAMTEHMASRRVMEKVGMRFEREVVPDAPTGVPRYVVYRIHRAEWRQRT